MVYKKQSCLKNIQRLKYIKTDGMQMVYKKQSCPNNV